MCSYETRGQLILIAGYVFDRMRSETPKWNGVKLGIGRLCGLKGRVIGSCCWLARSCLLACQPTTDGLLASSNTEQQPLPRYCQLPNCPMENPRPLLRQGTSSQYQNSYLDLAVLHFTLSWGQALTRVKKSKFESRKRNLKFWSRISRVEREIWNSDLKLRE